MENIDYNVSFYGQGLSFYEWINNPKYGKVHSAYADGVIVFKDQYKMFEKLLVVEYTTQIPDYAPFGGSGTSYGSHVAGQYSDDCCLDGEYSDEIYCPKDITLNEEDFREIFNMSKNYNVKAWYSSDEHKVFIVCSVLMLEKAVSLKKDIQKYLIEKRSKIVDFQKCTYQIDGRTYEYEMKHSRYNMYGHTYENARAFLFFSNENDRCVSWWNAPAIWG